MKSNALLYSIVGVVFGISMIVFINQLNQGPKKKIVSVEHAPLISDSAQNIKARHPDWTNHVCNSISQGQIFVGMTAAQVQTSWNIADKVNRTTTARSVREQWIYGDNYVYLEDDVVTSIQTSR